MIRKLIAPLLLGLLFISPAMGQKKPDKEELGLLGPVRTLTEEVEQADKPRVKALTVSFDKSCNKTEEIRYAPDGSIAGKTVYAYDAKGNLTGETGYDSRGMVSGKTSHKYDPAGRKIEILSHAADGQPLTTTSYSHDSAGRLVEESYQDHKSKELSTKILYTYDEKGRLLAKKSEGGWRAFGGVDETYDYDEKGLLIKRTNKSTIRSWRYTYDDNGRRRQEELDGLPPRVLIKLDDKGNVTKKVTGGGASQPIPMAWDAEETYAYDYDSHGNWIKQAMTKATSKQTKDSYGLPRVNKEYKLEFTKFRTLTYY
jgi:YD repeat-containing protein